MLCPRCSSLHGRDVYKRQVADVPAESWIMTLLPYLLVFGAMFILFAVMNNNAAAPVSYTHLTLVEGKPDPWKATSLGVGEMILDAVHTGCRNFIIGIGGSATTEGGICLLYTSRCV